MNPVSGKKLWTYKFKGNKTDAENPDAPLVSLNGTLYGTAASGYGDGCNGQGCGAIFSITTGGRERVIYHFTGKGDGGYPVGLLALSGKLYGFTQGPSYPYACDSGSCGTIFSVSLLGEETTLHAFDGTDGDSPSSLVAVKGKLYGTTTGGGNSGCNGHSGCGTAFSLTTSGHFKTLFTFTGLNGYAPSNLYAYGGKLYGAVEYYSNYRKSCTSEIFTLTFSGAEQTLFCFNKSSEGAYPGGFLAVDGVIYAVTATEGNGGSGDCVPSGCGTFFRITP